MKPKSFELTTVCESVERHVSDDPRKPSGWWLTLFVGADTKLRLFFPEDLFAISRTVGLSKEGKPLEQTVKLNPDVRSGQPVLMTIQVPLMEPNA